MTPASHSGNILLLLGLIKTIGHDYRYYGEAVEAGAERRYLLLARMAELLLEEAGGSYDPSRAGELYSEAAEAAMEEMAGKLATK